MKAGDKIKIAYLPAQYRIRAELTRALVMKFEEPPHDIMERAKKKLSKELTDKKIVFFRVFEERLRLVWQILQDSDLPKDATLGITLATGAPWLKGISVTPGSADGIGSVTIQADLMRIRNWDFSLFKLTVGKMLRDAGEKRVADPARLHAILMRAKHGVKIENETIYPIPRMPARFTREEKHELVYDPEKGEATLVVFDVTGFDSDKKIFQFLEEIAKDLKVRTNKHNQKLQFLGPDLVRKLRSAYRGVERLGVDLPMTLLAGYTIRVASEDQNNQPQKKPVAKPSAGKLKGVVELEVATAGVSAKIGAFNNDKYQAMGKVSLADWMEFIKSEGVVHGVDENAVKCIVQAAAEGKAIIGSQFAQGTLPQSPERPTLVQYFVNVDQDKVDVRTQQQRRLVKKGDKVAEISFEQPAKDGTNVYGEKLPAPSPQIPDVEVDENVETPDGLNFFAKDDGVPMIGESSITITKSLAIEGNVDLASGDIDFDGPGSIGGNIEVGATVRVTGDLTIAGSINGGNVYCGGDLTVEGGIFSQKGTTIRVKGDVSCLFIENAKVVCDGKLTVQKGIVNSDIFAKGMVHVTDDGSKILGGEVKSFDSVETYDLGKATGMVTRVTVGSSDVPRGVTIAMKRRDRFLQVLDQEKSSLEYAKDKSPDKMGDRTARQMSNLQERVPRLRRIVARLDEIIESFRANQQENTEAEIIVNGTLSPNTELLVCGKKASTPVEVTGVKVTPRRYKGSYVRPIKEPVDKVG